MLYCVADQEAEAMIKMEQAESLQDDWKSECSSGTDPERLEINCDVGDMTEQSELSPPLPSATSTSNAEDAELWKALGPAKNGHSDLLRKLITCRKKLGVSIAPAPPPSSPPLHIAPRPVSPGLPKSAQYVIRDYSRSK